MATLTFWSCLGLVAWTYLVYPAGMVLRAWRRTGAAGPADPPTASSPLVSVVVAVRNGRPWLDRRVANLLEQDYPPARLEVLVVCNGCTDGSHEVASGWAAGEDRIRALESPADEGKAGALNAGVAAAKGDVVVFADVRQSFDPDAIRLLVAALERPGVGAVTGRLLIGESERPAVSGFGRYWKLETRLRMAESETGSVVGATGAIYAIRRELFSPIPPGTLLDDVYVPLRVVQVGARVVMEPRAVARDEATATEAKEYRRRVRTLAGNLQLLVLAPEVVAPWHPLFVRFMSHKILRVLSPLFFFGVVVSGFWLGDPVHVTVALAVVGVYLLGAAGLLLPLSVLAVPAAFVLVQAAAVEAMVRSRRLAGRAAGRTAADIWTS